MKAISLWQPWASLVAHGLKHFETRSWAPNYRGPLAIHAAKRPMRVSELNPVIIDALAELYAPNELPYGCIVCTATLAAVYPTEQAITLPFFGPQERYFGDYTPGRFAWRLDNVQLVNNVPAVGSQGFWEAEL